MRRPGGYGVAFGPTGVETEHDTFTCNHCQQVVIVKPRCDPADMGGRCGHCDSLICAKCVGQDCVPFEEKLKRHEASYLARRSYGLI